jgi:PIN domain nuclease of toxin-antitoxin system
MRLLLDTHAFLWWMDGSVSLGSAARAGIADPENDILVSIASIWELTIKRALRKLAFPADPEAVFRDQGFAVLPISFAHLRQLEALPPLHRDPFDRMLIAQAMVEEVPLVTNDPALQPYGAPILW